MEKQAETQLACKAKTSPWLTFGKERSKAALKLKEVNE